MARKKKQAEMAQAPAIRRTELYKQRSALASGSAARCGIRSAA